MWKWIALIEKLDDLFWSVNNTQLHLPVFLVLYHIQHYPLKIVFSPERWRGIQKTQKWLESFLINGLKIVMKSCDSSLVFLLSMSTSTWISTSSDSVWHVCTGLVTKLVLCCQTQIIYWSPAFTSGCICHSYRTPKPGIRPTAKQKFIWAGQKVIVVNEWLHSRQLVSTT